MKSKLEERCRVLQISDTDWYIEAYTRAAIRLDDEMRHGNKDKIERLGRRLQHLFDKIVADLELDKPREERRKIAAMAINHAVADRKLPRSLLRPYERQLKTVPNDDR